MSLSTKKSEQFQEESKNPKYNSCFGTRLTWFTLSELLVPELNDYKKNRKSHAWACVVVLCAISKAFSTESLLE